MFFSSIIMKLLDKKNEEYDKFNAVYQRVVKNNVEETLSIPNGSGIFKPITYYPVLYFYAGRSGKIGVLGNGRIISPRRYPNHPQFVYIEESSRLRRQNGGISSNFDELCMFFVTGNSYVESVSKVNLDFLKLLLKSNMPNNFWHKKNTSIIRAYHGGRASFIYEYTSLIKNDKRITFKNLLTHFIGGETFLNFPVSEHVGSADYYTSSFLSEVSEKYLTSLSDEELISLDLSKLCLVDLIKDHLIITKLEGIS